MSADMMHIDESDLYDAVEGIISAADFIEMTGGAQLPVHLTALNTVLHASSARRVQNTV
jgi:peroxiredoxin family protein